MKKLETVWRRRNVEGDETEDEIREKLYGKRYKQTKKKTKTPLLLKESTTYSRY